jgi:hypothetical protein
VSSTNHSTGSGTYWDYRSLNVNREGKEQGEEKQQVDEIAHYVSYLDTLIHMDSCAGLSPQFNAIWDFDAP